MFGENTLYWFAFSYQIWVIATNAGVVYYSYDDVATPDLVTAWTVSSGALPLPTVTSTAPLSGVSVTAAFTVEMPMIIDFELYEELHL